MRNDDLFETPVQHTLTDGHQRHGSGALKDLFKSPFQKGIAFRANGNIHVLSTRAQYSTDFCQTKTAVCVLAKSA